MDELCEAERRALQDVALASLNKMDFNIPSSLVKGESMCLPTVGGETERAVVVFSSHLMTALCLVSPAWCGCTPYLCYIADN